MDIEAIKSKYLVNDDTMSKLRNIVSHQRKAFGFPKASKNLKASERLTDYVFSANEKLGGVGGMVRLERKNGGTSIGLNWKALGTVSVPEAQLFVKKLQQAIKLAQNAPKAPAGPLT